MSIMRERSSVRYEYKHEQARALEITSRTLAVAGSDRCALAHELTRNLAADPGDGSLVHLLGWTDRPSGFRSVFHRDAGACSLLDLALTGNGGSLSNAFVNRAMHSGQPVYMPRIPPDVVPLWLSPSYGEYLKHFVIKSVVAMPLQVEHQQFGSLFVWRDVSHRPYLESEYVLIRDVAYRVSRALFETARTPAESERASDKGR